MLNNNNNMNLSEEEKDNNIKQNGDVNTSSSNEN